MTTDANGLITYTRYDAFGRIKEMSSAWGTPAQINTTTEYRPCDNSCPENAAYLIIKKADNRGENRTYLDKLGRTLRAGNETVRIIGDAPIFVYVDYSYNHRGLNTAVSEPYFETDGPTHWSYFLYDDLA